MNKQFRKRLSPIKWIGVFSFLVINALTANAQFLRTSYFMEGTHYRQQLNPALTPTNGYLAIPFLGSGVSASITSSSLNYNDVIDVFGNGDDFYTQPGFMSRLKDDNMLNANLRTDILSAGWYKGKNFWSVNVGLRLDIGANITRNMFSFLNEMETVEENWRNSNYKT